MYVILHEDFDMKFGLSSFFLAVVGPQLLLRFRKEYAMEDLCFAALGMLGLLEGAEHNNKCNKSQRKHLTNRQPGHVAQHHIAGLETYLGALVLPQVDKIHEQALGGKPTSMDHRNRAAWSKYFGNNKEVLPEENDLRCCGCRTLKSDIHPMFRQFLPMLDHLPAVLPCAADAEAFLAQMELCTSSRVWCGGPPRRPTTDEDTGGTRSTHQAIADLMVQYFEHHGTEGYPLPTHPPVPVQCRWDPPPAWVPPAVHAEVSADDDFVKVGVALPPPLLPRLDHLFSKAVKNIREDKDDMASNWYLSTGARGIGFYRDKPRQRVDPHRTAPGQTTVQFHADLELIGIPVWYGGEGETKGEVDSDEVEHGPYVLSNNPNPGSSMHEMPTLEHVFRTHLLYDVGASDKLYCGLCGEVFMLIFAGMLGKEAQRCIPYLRDYFKVAEPGAEEKKDAEEKKNAEDSDEDGYPSSAESAKSDWNQNNTISDTSDEDEGQANQRSAVVGGRADGASTAPPQASPPGGTNGRNIPPPAAVPLHVRGKVSNFRQRAAKMRRMSNKSSRRGSGAGGKR